MRKLLLLIVVITLFVSFSFADDQDDRAREHLKSSLKREIEYEREDNGILIKARSKSSRLEFHFMQIPFLRFRMQYFTTNGSIVSRYKYRFGIRGIVEFNDVGTAGFDEGDTVVKSSSFFISKRQLEAQRWRSISITQKSVNKTDTIRFSNTLPFGFGNLVISGALAADTIRDELNRQLLPNAVKFDLKLENVTYKGNGTKIALITSIETVSSNRIRKSDTSSIPVSSQPEGELTVGDVSEGRITWVKTVTVWKNLTNPFINSSAPIVPTLLSLNKSASYFFDKKVGEDYDSDDDGDAQEVITLVAFTFDTAEQPRNYFWDPTSQINDGSLDSKTTTNGCASNYGWMGSYAMGMLMMLFWMMRD